MEEFEFLQPNNGHAHLREGRMLEIVVKYFNPYANVVCMGNLSKPVETALDVLRYTNEIMAQNINFNPFVPIMLTSKTTPEMIQEAFGAGVRFVKYIPAGASFGSSDSKGVPMNKFDFLYKLFSVIQECDMHLFLHSECLNDEGGNGITELDREEKSIGIVRKYAKDFPNMKIDIEHISTKAMVGFVRSMEGGNVVAKITPQHMLFTYSEVYDNFHVFKNPFKYCWPVVKREEDRLAIREFAVSGDERAIFGPDSAPHLITFKGDNNPKPGVFFGEAEIPLTFQIFEKEKATQHFEKFMSTNFSNRYGLPLNIKRMVLRRESWGAPEIDSGLRFTLGGERLNWKIKEIKETSE